MCFSSCVSLCYNVIRRAGSITLPLVTCLLMTVPATPLRGEKLTIPSIIEYSSWTPEAQRRFDWALGGINTHAMIQVGELTPGSVIDTDLPPIRMTIDLYRWTELWTGAQRLGVVDYQELIQWRQFVDSVEDCDSWLRRQRKMGIGPIYPTLPYPSVIDAGVPFFDTYTPEPILDPLAPTFTVVRPWLWGRE